MSALPEWLPWALLVLAIVIGWFAWWRADTRVRRGNRRRLRVAQAGETDAEALLEAEGFRIEARQVTRHWTLRVDGEPVEVHCRADLLVRARRSASQPTGARYVAEVKTGERAPDPTRPATRRQLLEYRLVFDVQGVLLVDVRAGTVHEVDFDLPIGSPQRRPG